MAALAGFSFIVGVPFALGVTLGMIPMRWPGKLALGASFPVAVALALYSAAPLDLADVGIGVIVTPAVLGWLLGFALAADVARLWRVLTR